MNCSHRHIVRLSGSLLSLALASCMTGPDYQAPALDIPGAFKSATTMETAEPQLDIEWWRLFDDLDLASLEENALAANFDLQAAVARVTQARAAVAAVRGGLYPAVSMNATATRSGRPGTDTGDSGDSALNEAASALNQISSIVNQIESLSNGTDATGNGVTSLATSASPESGVTGATTSTSFQLPFDLSYEIDFWGRIRRSVQAAQAQATASAFELEVVRQTLLADVAQNYFNIRYLDAQAVILANSITLYEEQVELTHQKNAAGLTDPTDLLQATVQLESARSDARDVTRQRDNAEHAVAILLGEAPAEFSLEPRPLEKRPPVIPAGLPGDLLRRRPDVARAEQELIAANADIGVATAEFFPSVRLTGSTGFESTGFSEILDWRNRFWSFGPSVSLPIFRGGQLKANLRQTQARYVELEANYRETVLIAFQDVENTLTDLHARHDQTEVQRKALEAAREYLRLTQIQYDTGNVDYLQVIDAQRTLLSHELSAANILNQRMVSTVLLMKALGGGWTAQLY